MKKNLTANFIYSLINQILAVVLPLITAPYVARILGAVGNGQYSYAYSIAQYFVVLSSLGFNSYGQREIAKENTNLEKRSQIFRELFILRFAISSISFLVFLFLGFFNCIGIESQLLMFAVSINILSVAFDLTFLFQGLEEFKMLAIRTALVRILITCLIFIFVRSSSDVWIYALCTALSALGGNLMTFFSLKGKIVKPKFHNFTFKKHIKPLLLLFLPNIAITLYTTTDKTMINLLTQGTQDFKDYSNGCYEQAYKINALSLIFVTVISSIFQSRNASLIEQKDMDAVNRNIKFAINYVWIIGTPLLFGFIVLSSNLTSWFLGSGYDDVPILMIIMAVRFIFSGFYEVFGNQILLVYGKEKYISIATWIAAVINIVLNIILIPFFGAIGAAIATAVCEFASFLFLLLIVLKFKYIDLIYFIKSSFKPFISGVIMFIVMFTIQYFWNFSILSFIVILLCGVFIYGISLLLMKDKFAIYIKNKIFNIIKVAYRKVVKK